MLTLSLRQEFSANMITTLPSRQDAGRQGVRPINLRRDTYQVLQLLDMAFGSELDAENRRSLQRSLIMASQPWYQPLVFPPGMALPGFIWEEDGSIVGNVSIMQTQEVGRYIIANVAVHPAWRRRGIAHQLMQTALSHLAGKRAHTIMLQVKQHNQAARELYLRLGFREIGAVTSWYGTPPYIRSLPMFEGGPTIRPLRHREWHAAYTLDLASMPADLNWPDMLRYDTYKTGLWVSLKNFANGRQAEHWATSNSADRLTGLASIYSEWQRSHMVTLRIHPDSRGQLERYLLAKALRRLDYLPQRQVRLDHPADDALMNQLLQEAQFRSQRTLIVMRLDLGSGATER